MAELKDLKDLKGKSLKDLKGKSLYVRLDNDILNNIVKAESEENNYG